MIAGWWLYGCSVEVGLLICLGQKISQHAVSLDPAMAVCLEEAISRILVIRKISFSRRRERQFPLPANRVNAFVLRADNSVKLL